MAITGKSGTNLGPLTTTWKPPATCNLYIPQCATCSAAFRAQSCNAASKGSPRDNTACWPPAKPGVTSPAWPFDGWGFYSPGLACPTGYTSACTAVYGQRPDWETEFKLFAGETAIGCCPPGFACVNLNGNTCVKTVTAHSAVSTAHCSGTSIADVTSHFFPDTITVSTTPTAAASTASASASTAAVVTTTVHRTMTLYAPMFQLNFRSTDLLSTSATTTSNSSATDLDSSTSPPPPPEETTATGLSQAAKVGIGVGVPVGAIALIAPLAFFLLRRRKYARFETPPPEAGKLKDYGPNTEPTFEMPATPLVELPAENAPQHR